MAVTKTALVMKFDFTRYVRSSFAGWGEPKRDNIDESDLFYLGWQNKLASLLFQFCEIGIWITTEAGAQDAGVAFLAETVSEFVPSRAIDAAQIGTAGWMLAGGHGRDQARLAA